MRYINSILIVFLTFLLIQGCGKKEQQSDSQVPADEQKTEIQSSGEQTETNQASLETKQGLPEDFPKDIPLPEKIKKTKYIDNNANKIVILDADISVSEAISYYKENMKKNGFDLNKNDSLIDTDNIYNADWRKGNRNVNIAITFQNNITTVVISY